MGRFFSVDSPFFQKLSTFADLVLLNVLTILCSLPVITAGAAGTALFYTVAKLRKGDGGIFRSYFRCFKDNFRQATILWLILLVVGAGACFCILMYYQANLPILVGCSVLLLLVWGIVLSWLFPMLSRFCSTTFGALKNAVICGINFLPLSLAMTLVNLVPLFLFLFVPEWFFRLLAVWLFLWFSLAAYCNSALLQKPFERLMPDESEQAS